MNKVEDIDFLKQTELNILKHIDKICREKGLTYYLVGGTLLGAIRHNGFIPWDDDIDIAMSRDDLEILYKTIDGSKYKVFLPTTEGYYYNFAKVVDKTTKVTEHGYKPINGMGVWVDIFVLDELAGSYDEVNIKYEKLNNIRDSINIYATKPVMRKNIIAWIKSVFTCCFLNRKNLMRYQKEYISLAKEYSGPGEYVYVTGGAYGKKDIFKREYYGIPIYARFEDADFPIPCQYEEVLKQLYGNYMELPPENKRKTNHKMRVSTIEK